MWHVLSRISKNLHRDTKIDRKGRSEELMKKVGGQKIFIFRGGLPYEEVREFSFSGDLGL